MELIKEINLSGLPRTIYRGKKVIDWRNSIGYKINFVYNKTEGYLEIINYIVNKNKKPTLIIRFNHSTYTVGIDTIRECKLGGILGARTGDFKIGIGQVFKDNKRNLIIIDREYRKDKKGQNWKWYKYHCNKCGWEEGWIVEHLLLGKQRCSCCSNQIVVKGINDIATTNPDLVKYFVNIEDAYTHTYSSTKKVKLMCPNCKTEKIMDIYYLYHHDFLCNVCGDFSPYPEKVMDNLLKQLKIDFKTQLSKTTFKWCDKYKYDFYFVKNGQEYIIETHGKQHYKKSFETLGGKTLEEEQENDKIKKDLAIHNGIKEENYIVVDCRESDINFIKSNIINSKLNDVFDLNNIDWIETDKQCQKSIIKEVCTYKNNNEDLSLKIIGDTFNKSDVTIRKYLKIGARLGWCNYNAEEEVTKTIKNNAINNSVRYGKKVEISKDGDSLGIFESCHELDRVSKEIFGVQLSFKKISEVCLKHQKKHRGYEFKYV